MGDSLYHSSIWHFPVCEVHLLFSIVGVVSYTSVFRWLFLIQPTEFVSEFNTGGLDQTRSFLMVH
jgi:hypothetical protein